MSITLNNQKHIYYPAFLALSVVRLLAYDGDSSGVSDVYENIHGQILPATEDADFDGHTNYLESLFGSDPLDATDPGDFDFSVFGTSATMKVPNQIGLRYRVESKQDLGAASWDGVGAYEVSDGSAAEVIFDLTNISAAFFRLGLAPPLNSDTDGLNDWEEAQLGTDPTLSDTDNDLLDDDIETMVAGSDPHKVDTDGDGYVDKDEYESGSDPDDATAWPPEILNQAYSRPMTIQNTAAPTQFYPDFWSQPMTVTNLAAPVALFDAVWSAPVTVTNAAAPVELFDAVWSAPIVVRNDALALSIVSEIWSAPILVRNDYTEPEL